MAILQEFRTWMWNEKNWLMDSTWEEFENPPQGVYYPLERHILLPSILFGFILLGIRITYDRYVVVPYAKYMGLTFKKHYAVEKNPILDAAYAVDKWSDKECCKELSKKTSLTEREIQRWFRHRRSKEMPGRMKKFRECSWLFLFYTSSFLYGLYILWDKPYFWDTKYCWTIGSKGHVPNDIYLYYTIEMGFYWQLLFTLMSDVKRSDFREMVIHHIVTITLIYFSFACNQVRIGSLVIILHDSNDVWMSASKSINYLKKQRLAEIVFVIFALIWFISKLYIYPFWIVWSTTFESAQYIENIRYIPVYWFLNGLLWTLQVLHILWTIMIIGILRSKVTEEKMRDVRSDTEDSTGTEDEETSQETEAVGNGNANGLSRRPQTSGNRG